MLLPESVNQNIQNGDNEDKAEHLNIHENSKGVQGRKINNVDSISSFLEKVWYTKQKLFLPAHALAVEVQLPGVIDRGDDGGSSEEHAHLGSRDNHHPQESN